MSAPLAKRPQVPRAVDDEVLHGALQEIKERGHLLRFAADRAERLALMQRLSKWKVIWWDKVAGRYELTALGHDCLQGWQGGSGSRRARGDAGHVES